MSMIGYKSENHPQQTALRGALDVVLPPGEGN